GDPGGSRARRPDPRFDAKSSMTAATLLIRHGRIATMTGAQNAPGEGPLGLVEDGLVAIAGEQIIHVEPEATARVRKGKAKPPPGEGVEIEVAPNAVEIDAQGQLVTPGFVEPHSHLLFAGDRANEFSQRLAGATYAEIGRAGGGSVATVKSTREATDEDLVLAARERLGRLARAGVTTAEVKTGYALSVEGELRLLKLIREAANGAPCDVVPTLLALHAVPPGMESRAWVESVLKELLPQAAADKLAHGVDAFCEKGAFGTDECRTILEAGVRGGLVGHLHADQLTNSGGAALAAATRELLLQESRGKLVPGLRGDIVVHGTKDPAHLPYHGAVEHARVVVRRGKVELDLRKEPLRCG